MIKDWIKSYSFYGKKLFCRGGTAFRFTRKMYLVVGLDFNAKVWFIIQKEEKLSNNFKKLYA